MNAVGRGVVARRGTFGGALGNPAAAAPQRRLALALALALVLLACALAWATPRAAAAGWPAITQPVTDEAGVLSPADEERVAERLVAYRAATGVQLAVVIVATTGGVSIDDWTHALFRAWGGGSKERNDGALFVLAIADRTNRLEVGYGLEGHISDGLALDLLVALRPLLRAERYGDACLQLVADVWSATADITPGEPVETPLSRQPLFFLAMMLVAIAGTAAWVARRPAAGSTAPPVATKKRGKGAAPPVDPQVARAARRVRTVRRLETLALFVIAPLLLAVLTWRGTQVPLAWVVAWESWVLIAWLGVELWRAMPIARWFWLVPSAAAIGVVVFALLGGYHTGASPALIGDLIESASTDLLVFSLGPLGAIGFWSMLVIGAASPGSGGSSGSSYRGSSASRSSSSSSNSSSRSSSSWSGGGGSSGGGGASSSW